MKLQIASEYGRGCSFSPFQTCLVTSKHFTVLAWFINCTVQRPECPLESANRLIDLKKSKLIDFKKNVN